MGETNINLPSLPDGAKEYVGKIFGPIAEVGDLLTEKIRFYRWKSSLETMDRARIIAHERGLDVNEVPFRKLVPLLEKSSLEEPDSPLIDKWASLLALASHDEDKVSVSYIDILSRVDLASIQLLDRTVSDDLVARVLQKCSDDSVLGFADHLDSLLHAHVHGMEDRVLRDSKKYPEPVSLDDKNFKRFFRDIFYPLANIEELVPIPVSMGVVVEREGGRIHSFANNFDLDKSILDSLRSVGLMQNHVALFNEDRFRLKFVCAMPTALGFRFVMACRGKGIEHL